MSDNITGERESKKKGSREIAQLEAFSCTRGRPGLVDALRHFILQV
jgi:hypothetical protein